MCAKFEYRNLSRYYSTNSATPPYISTNGTVNTRLLTDQFNGYQDLALAVGKASDVISSLQLLAPKRQTALTDYFK